jgi:pseudaminic acid biosynthesis-associated methylase
MENTKQIEAWSGEFGDAYTARNQVTWWNRVPFWADVMARTRPTEVLEVGCNAGWNLMAIRATGFRVPMRGIDVNRGAIARATEARLDAVVGTVHDVVSRYELVFTAGVLIHVAPDQLEETMKAIIDRSHRWVLAIEYEALDETEIPYRGETGLLWKRPFGRMYVAHGLKLVDAWDAAGFDRCTAWLLEKTLVIKSASLAIAAHCYVSAGTDVLISCGQHAGDYLEVLRAIRSRGG